MIISPKYKFVFIANTKTGSTSIHKTLLDCVKDKNLINESKHNLGDKDKHLPCTKLIEQYPQYKDYFKFAFVRNPWDRVVSWYVFCKKSPFVSRNTSNISFKEFIETRPNIWRGPKQFQYEFTKKCEFIGKTENIQKDFNKICDTIGIPRQKLPHRNATKHKHYTDHYDDDTRGIVAEVFTKDIEYFGYEFGE